MSREDEVARIGALVSTGWGAASTVDELASYLYDAGLRVDTAPVAPWTVSELAEKLAQRNGSNVGMAEYVIGCLATPPAPEPVAETGLRAALDGLFAVTPIEGRAEGFYIEARVGSENYRHGGEVRFVVDRRNGNGPYTNVEANERVEQIIAAVNAVRAALTAPVLAPDSLDHAQQAHIEWHRAHPGQSCKAALDVRREGASHGA